MPGKHGSKTCPTCGREFALTIPTQTWCSKTCRRGSGRTPINIIDRFMSHVCADPFSGCWLWGSQLNHNGYGVFRLNSRQSLEHRSTSAHRIAYELFVGAIPSGMQLDHLCRVRCCVNPAHMEIVSLQENLRRGDGNRAAVRSIRANAAKITHCPLGHAYDEANTLIHSGKRHCRACRAIHSREFKQRLKDRHR